MLHKKNVLLSVYLIEVPANLVYIHAKLIIILQLNLPKM